MDKALKEAIGIVDLGDGGELESAPTPDSQPPPKPTMEKIVGSNDDLDGILGIESEKTEEKPEKEEKKGNFSEIEFSKDDPINPNVDGEEVKEEKKPEPKPEPAKTEEKEESKNTSVASNLDFLEENGVDKEKTEDILDEAGSETSDTDTSSTESNTTAETGSEPDAETKKPVNQEESTAPPVNNTSESSPDLISEHIKQRIEELSDKDDNLSQKQLSFYNKLSSYYARMRTVLIFLDYDALYEEMGTYSINLDRRLHTPQELNEQIQRAQEFKNRVSEIFRMALRDYIPRNRMYELFEKMSICNVEGKSSDIRKGEAAELMSVLHGELIQAETFYKSVNEVYTNLNSAYESISRQITIFQEQNKEIQRGSMPYIPDREMNDVEEVGDQLHDQRKADYIRGIREEETRTTSKFVDWSDVQTKGG